MASKPILISGHARFEMKRRGITAALVIRTIRSPGQVMPSVRGRSIYQSLLGRAGRMLLRVVVAEDAAAYHVITAYKTSKVAKYWGSP
jgi:hypothetical protein